MNLSEFVEVIEPRVPHLKFAVNMQGAVRYNNRVLPQYKSPQGYLGVSLRYEGMRENVYVHRLVALAFVEKPTWWTLDGLVVNHKDGNKTNNVPSNLEWVSKSHDAAHAFRLGLNKSAGWRRINELGLNRGERAHKSTLTADDVRAIRASYPQQTLKQLSHQYGVSPQTIHAIVKRYTWNHI